MISPSDRGELFREPAENEARSRLVPADPPLVWPGPMVSSGEEAYENNPPFPEIRNGNSDVLAWLVDIETETVEWVRGLLSGASTCTVRLLAVVYPACPTREEVLRELLTLQETHADHLQVRLAVDNGPIDSGMLRNRTVASQIQFYNRKTGKTIWCVGGTGNAGRSETVPGSMNLVFEPDAGLRDEWTGWFGYQWALARTLTPARCEIPLLRLPPGGTDGDEAWREYVASFQEEVRKPKLDPETGRVVEDAEGKKLELPGPRPLSKEARLIQEIYAKGRLVTVNEATRIRPLSVPLKAALLREPSEAHTGAVTRKQQFSLQVLDDSVSKKLDGYRKITDLLALFSYPLSKGVRWIPEKAIPLLEVEGERRNKEAMALLTGEVGGEVEAFVSRKEAQFRKDITQMYQELKGAKGEVDETAMRNILNDVRNRLTAALSGRITPTLSFNGIQAPELSEEAPDENWEQPLQLLFRSAETLRKSYTDPYFPRNFTKTETTIEQYRQVMDVFGDVVVKTEGRRGSELEPFHQIHTTDTDARTRFTELLNTIRMEVVSR